jgi:hypothetical protein
MEIDLIFIDGRGNLEEAFRAFFPQAVICINTYLWVINGRETDEIDEEFEEMTADLRALYETETT